MRTGVGEEILWDDSGMRLQVSESRATTLDTENIHVSFSLVPANHSHVSLRSVTGACDSHKPHVRR